jgi:S1-C subfamily serine protease
LLSGGEKKKTTGLDSGGLLFEGDGDNWEGSHVHPSPVAMLGGAGSTCDYYTTRKRKCQIPREYMTKVLVSGSRMEGNMRDDWSLRAILEKRQNMLMALSVLAICAGLATTNIYERSLRPDAKQIIDSVVSIGGADGRMHGSGVVMEGGRYVLTVNHVIDEQAMLNQPILVTYRDGERVVAQLMRRNRHFDIALLRLPSRHVKGLRLVSDAGVKQGDRVRAIGHPFGIMWMLTDGIISKKSYFPPNPSGDAFVLWMTAPIESGNSGGPLVNENGEIIGLVMAFVNPRGVILGATHFNICVSGSEIIRFLENP